MKRRPRIYYTEEQKSLMWDRWLKGDSLQSIARLFDRHHSSVACILRRTGGIRPPARKRAPRTLTFEEREEISRGLSAGHSLRSIARGLNRSPSTISREVRRNGGVEAYRANTADQAAWDRACRPKPCKLVMNRALARIVAEKLQLQWSPQQIAGWLQHTYPHDESYQVSHETIYRSLYIQARGALKKELLGHLRKTRAMRRSRHKTLKGEGLGQITDTVSIRERPAEAEDQARAQVTTGTLQVAHLGSRPRDGRSSTFLARHRHQGVLLRSTTPLATRFEREHQWPAQTVLPEGNGLVPGASE